MKFELTQDGETDEWALYVPLDLWSEKSAATKAKFYMRTLDQALKDMAERHPGRGKRKSVLLNREGKGR